MTAIDLDAIRVHIHDTGYCRGTTEQVAMWREDLIESRANLAIEDMDLDAQDEALFSMMLDEALSPAMMVEVITWLYSPGHDPASHRVANR